MRIIDEPLLDQFRGPGRCEHCGKLVRKRDPHHWAARGIGGGGRLDVRCNLVALCSTFAGGGNCHRLAHDGKIKRDVLLGIIAARERTTPEAVEAEIWRLRRTPKGAE